MKRVREGEVEEDDLSLLSAAKIQKSFIGISLPGESSSSNANDGSNPPSSLNVPTLPLTERQNETQNDNEAQKPLKGKKRKRRGKLPVKPRAKVVQLLPPTLSDKLVKSLRGVASPTRTVCSLPILHPRASNHKEHLEKILASRNAIFGSGNFLEEVNEDSRSIFIGVLECKLEKNLNLKGIFKEGKGSVYLALLLDQDGRWLVKLVVGELVRYFQVSVDSRLSRVSVEVIKKLFPAISTVIRLYLPHDQSSACSKLKCLCLELWAMGKICEFDNPSDLGTANKQLLGAKEWIISLVNTLYPKYGGEERITPTILQHRFSVEAQVQEFYSSIQQQKTAGKDKGITSEHLPHLPGLLAVLRNYQQQAVIWMLEREGVTEGAAAAGAAENDQLHVLWKRLPAMFMQVYFNPYTARFTSEFFSRQVWPSGGILADEMGLGKTVEILALILAHKWPGMECDTTKSVVSDSNPYLEDTVSCFCGLVETGGDFVQCEVCFKWQHISCCDFKEERDTSFVCVKCLLKDPLLCKTTLIVCPDAIYRQWKEEIVKHTEEDALTVLMYPGVAKKYVSPQSLASYDIVLASYEILRSELYHVTSQDFYKKLRHPKRFGCVPSPLPALLWWRICLDEAQMVESTTAKAAEMMQKLTAVNRWCVTGTPVQKDLRDLCGLMMFLHVDPYNIQQWYDQLLWQPLLQGKDFPMISLFSHLMWRNSKADVAAELQLPEHKKEIHWVTFSSVEKYFYRRQHETCVSKLFNLPYYSDVALSSMSHAAMNEILTPLHSLRQACCTPQIVRTGYLSREQSKNPITMDILLTKLTQQAKAEAREALRLLVSTLNGLAGLHSLNNEKSVAVSCYREAMTLWQEYKEQDVECDRLQRIHTMENLHLLLEENSQGEKGDGEDLGHTLRDDTLMEEAKQLRVEYSKRASDNVRAAAETLMASKECVTRAREKARVGISQFIKEQEQSQELSDSDRGPNNTSTDLADHTSPDPADHTSSDPVDHTSGVSDPDHTSSDPDHTSSDPVDHASSDPADHTSGVSDPDHTSSDPVDHSSFDPIDRTSVDHVSDPDCTPGLGHNSSDPDPDRTSCDAVPDHTSSVPNYDIGPCITSFDDQWWPIFIQWCKEKHKDGELLDAVHLELSSTQDTLFSSLSFTEMSGLSYFLYEKLEAIEVQRAVVWSSLEILSAEPTPELVDRAVVCHLAPSGWDEEEPCDCCTAEFEAIQYERELFSAFQIHTLAEHGDGSRFPSTCERILKSMLSFARHNGVPKSLVNAGQLLINYLEAMRKEYPVLRSLWMTLEQRLGTHYELQQASTKLCLISDYDETTKGATCVFEEDVPLEIRANSIEKNVYLTKLKKCVGQVMYLKSLEKFQHQKDDNEDPCPICTVELGKKWSMFPCGHSLCLKCTDTLISQKHGGPHYDVSLSCPLCREACTSSEVNYVELGTQHLASKLELVSDEHASKILSVVRTLLEIQRNDPGAKALVFSQWLEVLVHISDCLHENGIPHFFNKTKSSFQGNLASFRADPNNNILLLPFTWGSKGLNIVEASHVLLVEPQLSVATELQAIGRVHRIGQTRPTCVHHFIVQHTIEERLHTLLHSSQEDTPATSTLIPDSMSNLTCKDIRNLVLGGGEGQLNELL